MGIQDSLNAAKMKLEEMMRDRRFRKANLAREEKVALQPAQAMCRGKLEICQRDFERIIRDQSKYIREGQSIGADTLIQEQMLWDAAIGYMMVKDAIYSLRTINNHNSLAHAYEMMDMATKQTSGKKSGLPIKTIRNRNIYGFVTSSAAYNEKSELLDSFFEELKVTGKIEECLSNAQRPGYRDAVLRNSYTMDMPLSGDSGMPAPPNFNENDSMSRLRAAAGTAAEEPDFTIKENPMVRGINYGKDE